MYQPAVKVVRIVAYRVVMATAGAVVASTSSFADNTVGVGPFGVPG